MQNQCRKGKLLQNSSRTQSKKGGVTEESLTITPYSVYFFLAKKRSVWKLLLLFIHGIQDEVELFSIQVDTVLKS